MADGLFAAFNTTDQVHIVRDNLRETKWVHSPLDYNSTFRAALLQCIDIIAAEALGRHIYVGTRLVLSYISSNASQII